MGVIVLIAPLIGALWGFTAMLVIGILVMLVTGVTTAPPLGLAAAVGALVGLAAIIWPYSHSNNRYSIVVGVTLLALLVITGQQPFGAALENAFYVQMVAAGLWAAAVARAISACLAGYNHGPVSRYRLEVLFIRVLKGFAFVVFTVLVVLPFYVMVMTSLKSQQSLLRNPLDFSVDLSQGVQLFSSYVELFEKFNFGTFLFNSAVVSVATVIITLAFAVPGAYAVARLKFPGQAFLSRSILLIYMVPAIVLVIPLYAVFSQAGLRNTLTGLLIVYPATTIPVALYMLQGYFRGLPAELEEAGTMDGLSRVGVIFKITLPLALPALASVSLYVFMIAWNEFLFAFMFLDDLEIFTLSRGVVSLNSSEVPRQHLMAGAVVATVPVLVLFLWFERFLVAGLTAGSVKG